MRSRSYLDWVKSLGVCFVQVYLDKLVKRAVEIPDEQERRDYEHDLILLVAEHGRCWGPIDPDHMGDDRGAGLRCSDDETAPMCRRHHGHRHDRSGFFEGYSDEEERRFRREALEWTRDRWLQHQNPDQGLAF